MIVQISGKQRRIAPLANFHARIDSFRWDRLKIQK